MSEVAEIARALAAYDASIAKCPVSKPRFDPRNACPLCHATSQESCGRAGGAGYELAEAVRQHLLSTNGADQ